jgi:multiple sugar transport system substrate-binding protein
MAQARTKFPTRRKAIKLAGMFLAAPVLAPAIIPSRARAQTKTLRILRWKNFVPAYEAWFNDVFTPEWGARNDTDVIVTNVGLGDIGKLATAEIAAGEGHDMALFLSPRPSLEDHAIDHREIMEECASRFGQPYDFAKAGVFNPRTGRYHGFCESYAPTLATYRKDIWDAVGTVPNTWDDVRAGGRAVRLLHDKPVGISFAPEHNAEHSLRALMAAFGASVQNAEGVPALASDATLEALKFAKALFEETMDPSVLTWTPPSNNQAILSGGLSLTIDTMSIIRAAESTGLPVETDLALAPLPEGPAGRIGPAFATNTYMIWKFARNIDSARQFLIDYTGAFGDGLAHSGFQSMPCFPGAIPDLASRISASPGRPGRYELLNTITDTLTNLGYPGHSNAATDEILDRHIVVKMFAQVVAGKTDPQDAMQTASAEIAPIFQKWRQAGKI